MWRVAFDEDWMYFEYALRLRSFLNTLGRRWPSDFEWCSARFRALISRSTFLPNSSTAQSVSHSLFITRKHYLQEINRNYFTNINKFVAASSTPFFRLLTCACYTVNGKLCTVCVGGSIVWWSCGNWVGRTATAGTVHTVHILTVTGLEYPPKVRWQSPAVRG